MKPWMTWLLVSLTYAFSEFVFRDGDVAHLFDASYYTAAGMFAYWLWHTPTPKEPS